MHGDEVPRRVLDSHFTPLYVALMYIYIQIYNRLLHDRLCATLQNGLSAKPALFFTAISDGVKDETTAFERRQTNGTVRMTVPLTQAVAQMTRNQKKSIKPSTFSHTCGQIHLGVV